MTYLDTHVVVWLYQKTLERLSQRSREHIEKDDIVISPMVVLEIEYLFEVEKISERSQIIIGYLAERIGLRICDQPFQDVMKNAVGIKWTRDPFDRLITAQALSRNAILISKDASIQKNYQHAVW